MTNVRPIISRKDLSRLSAAQARGDEIEIELEYKDARIRLSTTTAPNVWRVGYIIRMEVWRPGIYSSQYFASTEDIV